MKEIRWHGRGGQGAFTACKILGGAAVLSHKYALAFPSFGPERRGAPIQAFTKIDDTPVIDRSAVTECDYIIFLDETLYKDTVKQDLKPGGKILLNTKRPQAYAGDAQVIALDADSFSVKILKRPVSNTAMLALLAKTDAEIDRESILKALADYLPQKIVEKNRMLINSIFETEC